MLSHQKVKLKILISQLLAILPFLIFIFVLFDLWYDTRRELVVKENLTTANILADSINSVIQTGVTTSNILGQSQIFEMMETSNLFDDRDSLHNLLSSVRDQMSERIDSISLVSPEGKMIASSLDFELIPDNLDLSDRDYFKKAIDTGKPALSEMITGRITSKNIVVAATPLVRNNKTIAVLLTNVDLDVLKKNMMEFLPSKIDSNDQLILIDAKGKLIMHLCKCHTQEHEDLDFSSVTSVRNAMNGKPSIIDGEKLLFSNKILIGAAVPVSGKDLGWTIISVSSAESIYLPVIKAQSYLWILILLSIAFVLALTSFVLRKIKLIY